MKKLILYSFLVFLTTSCLKKLKEVDELNTNIFDKEYAGDTWFVIDDMSTILIDGQTRYKMEVRVQKSFLPGLKPSSIFLDCQVNSQEYDIVEANLNSDGEFDFFLIVIPDGTDTYCLAMGLYVNSEEITINSFTSCYTL